MSISLYDVVVVLTCIQKLNDCMNTSTGVSSFKPTCQMSWTWLVVEELSLTLVMLTLSFISLIVTKFGMQTIRVTKLTRTIDSLARPTLHQIAPCRGCRINKYLQPDAVLARFSVNRKTCSQNRRHLILHRQSAAKAHYGKQDQD